MSANPHSSTPPSFTSALHPAAGASNHSTCIHTANPGTAVSKISATTNDEQDEQDEQDSSRKRPRNNVDTSSSPSSNNNELVHQLQDRVNKLTEENERLTLRCNHLETENKTLKDQNAQYVQTRR